ncbi:hypothetical protein BpHYR1_047457 [Brachionus plicatilis]|uniref:Uncharacterized protein n=1 Tax=Brachionus plicatilis TaxID=10195 RepID=A0A3M7QB74_BRAPC|nr:hypothetical protein BpHYR1_047457 [Brachionus plicatilis]
MIKSIFCVGMSGICLKKKKPYKIEREREKRGVSIEKKRNKKTKVINILFMQIKLEKIWPTVITIHKELVVFVGDSYLDLIDGNQGDPRTRPNGSKPSFEPVHNLERGLKGSSSLPTSPSKFPSYYYYYSHSIKLPVDMVKRIVFIQGDVNLINEISGYLIYCRCVLF